MIRRSDAETAALILRERGYKTTQVNPEAGQAAGVVVFLDPGDLDGPGAFGVLRLTAEDVIRHCHNPGERDAGIRRLCDRAEGRLQRFKARWTNH